MQEITKPVWAKYSGANDVAGWFKGEMSPLGEEVANILGEWAGGIYHLAVSKVDWSDRYSISFNYDGNMSSWDGSEIPRLFFLCSDRAVRLEIQQCNMRYIRLVFHLRKSRLPMVGLSRWHPTPEQTLAYHRAKYPAELIVKTFEADLAPVPAE